MAVVSLYPYEYEPLDKVENFHGKQLLYIGWEDHLMFCAPLAFPFPPSMPFQDIIKGVLPGAYGYHPDFAQIDWTTVQWFKSGKPWQPTLEKTLEENGLNHKDVIRFRTPGLTGIKSSFS